MSVAAILYGTQANFAQSSNINSLANGAAKAIGIIANTADPLMINAKVFLQITLASSAVATYGFIEVWVVESLDGSVYSDGINPTGSSDVVASLKNAKMIKVIRADTNSQVCRAVIDIGQFLGDMPPFLGVVISNRTGATIAASGNAASYMPLNIETLDL